VLFELICDRYKRRSMLNTSNQPFTAREETYPSHSLPKAAQRWDSASERGTRAINQIKAIPVTAPAALRERLESLPHRPLIESCAALRPGLLHGPVAAAERTLPSLARQVQGLEEEIPALREDLDQLTQPVCPAQHL
jgi:hypothetical protein